MEKCFLCLTDARRYRYVQYFFLVCVCVCVRVRERERKKGRKCGWVCIHTGSSRSIQTDLNTGLQCCQ